jgi:Xaa-Pro dipeptidase
MEQSWVRDHVTFADWEDPVELLARTVIDRGWASAAIGQELDSSFLSVRTSRAVQRRLPGATFADFSHHLWELRLRKSQREVELLERASAIADQAMLAGVRAAGVGRPERAVIAAATAAALLDGADNTRIALMASGGRRDQLHGRLGERLLEDGDAIHLELVPHFHGYSARTMRTIAVGAATKELEATASRLIEIQDDQFGALRPGMSGAGVDAIARDQLIASGLVEDYPNTTGYTLGLVGVPRTTDFTRTLLPTATWPIEEGMVFHMYLAARGVTLSETVLVTDDGCRRLTRLDRRLFTAGE